MKIEVEINDADIQQYALAVASEEIERRIRDAFRDVMNGAIMTRQDQRIRDAVTDAIGRVLSDSEFSNEMAEFVRKRFRELLEIKVENRVARTRINPEAKTEALIP